MLDFRFNSAKSAIAKVDATVRFVNSCQRRIDAAPKRDWSIAEIDLSKDKEQFIRLTPAQQRVLIAYLQMNAYGESAVEAELSSVKNYFESEFGSDSAPAKFVRNHWIPEEERHAAFSMRYLKEVCGNCSEDSTKRSGRYYQIFDELLRGVMSKLDSDPSPQRALPAIAIYTAFVESTIAVPAFKGLIDALNSESRGEELLPGLRKGIEHFVKDEAHHVGVGKDFIRFCDKVYGRGFVVRYGVGAVLRNALLAIATVNEFFALEKPFPFGIKRGAVLRHALRNISGFFKVLRRNQAADIEPLDNESLPSGYRS